MSEQPILVLDPTGANHHAEHQALRSRGPATRVDILGVTAWSVSDPALLKQLLTSPQVSKDGRAHWPAFADTVPTWPLALWIAVNNMFTAHGGDHRRLRRMVAPAFSARRVQAMQSAVEAIVTALLDDLDTRPAGESIDLREHLAYPLPIAVIGRLVGVPDDQRDSFRAVVDGVFDTTLTRDQAATNTAALYNLLDQLIAAKRTASGDDMTSFLITARDDEAEGDGSGFTDDELRDTLLLMISAGYETTVNGIDHATTALLADPEQLAHLRAGRADWNDVVEETLRHEPAIKHLPLRYALTDIPLPDGQTILRGEAILASYAAANQHPHWHGENADRFDITRPTKEHLAFGHGVHFCLGAPLARLEIATTLQLLFDRFPELQLAVPAEKLKPLPSLISNGHQTLPVHLRPATNQTSNPTAKTRAAGAATITLTPAEQRVAEHLALGLAPRDIATAAHLSPHTVRSYMRTLRRKLQTPPRCALHVLVHTLLTTGQITPPTTTKPTPDLSPAEQLLLRAVAEHTDPHDIARAARIAPADVSTQVDALLTRTRASDTTQLIVLAHAWNLLGTSHNKAPSAGANR
ncbi:cytochrome P450 [Streptomyces paludis]|uniref:Cytochrome P450 n=1 Tax=Streptomyces paludis TaxID=2282738 RepID=A0A345HVW5_9ACTN|nr:cytochrome P450 [Streptomyces paludis]